MKRLITGACALAASIGALAVFSGSALAHAPGYGCPRGAVCIYPAGSASWNNPNWQSGPEPGGIFYTYGAHNLSGQYGWHLVFNNQYNTGGSDYAGVSFCKGYNGRGGYSQMAPDSGLEDGGTGTVYFTPVNSIVLWLHYPSQGVFSGPQVCR